MITSPESSYQQAIYLPTLVKGIDLKTMRTPYGVECPYFYGDYYRGKSDEECRLIGRKPAPNHWSRDLCQNCPVPAITRANSCKNMLLTPVISRRFGIGKRRVEIKAFCTRANSEVRTPQIGCGLCHPLDDFQVPKKPS